MASIFLFLYDGFFLAVLTLLKGLLEFIPATRTRTCLVSPNWAANQIPRISCLVAQIFAFPYFGIPLSCKAAIQCAMYTILSQSCALNFPGQLPPKVTLSPNSETIGPVSIDCFCCSQQKEHMCPDCLTLDFALTISYACKMCRFSILIRNSQMR